MVELGCQDTDWVGGNDKEVLDAILLREGLILDTLGMDKGKCGYFGCISGWFWAPRHMLYHAGTTLTTWDIVQPSC